MYITDMYRGIIQESQWTGPGTYLRAKIDQYGLDKVVRHGRIWRLTYEGMARRDRRSRGCSTRRRRNWWRTSSDPNGWWRDTAQQLLVLKQDKSVVPALQASGAAVHRSLRAHSRALDARGPRRRRCARCARADEGRGPADPHPGDSRERDALQGRRQDTRGGLPRDDEGARRGRGHAGGPDDQPAEGRRRGRRDQGRRRTRIRRSACSTSPTAILNPPAARGRGGGVGGRGGATGATRRRAGRRSNAGSGSTPSSASPATAKTAAAATDSGAPARDGAVAGGVDERARSRDYVIKVLLHGLTGPMSGVTYQ